jgi:PAS domain-containing protein
MAQQPIELILFRQLATNLVVPVFLVDDHGDLVFLNEAAGGLLGIRVDDVDQLPFERWATMFRPRTPDGEVMPPETLPLSQAVLKRRPAHGTICVTGADGVERTLEVTAFPLEGSGGRLIGAVAMFWEREPA